MKNSNKLKSAIILALLIAVTGTSCKKDNSNTPSTTGGKAEVKANNYGFDGTAGAAFSATAAGMVQVGPIWTLSAIKDGTNQSISIVLSNVTGTGTYKLDQDNTEGNGAIMTKDYTKPSDGTLNYSTDNASSTGMKGGGEVKITSYSSTSAEGTFYIVAHNSAGKEAFVEQGTFKGTLNKK
jgi:hypothetical protein